MRCPRCDQLASDTKATGERSVITKRDTRDGRIWRRRQCKCGCRFTTFEEIDQEMLAQAPAPPDWEAVE
jgi:transcriptional regulator NrdR family protein